MKLNAFLKSLFCLYFTGGKNTPHALNSILSNGYNTHSDYILIVMTRREGTEEDDQRKPGLLFF